MIVNNTLVTNDGAAGGSEVSIDGFDNQTQLWNNIFVGKAGQTAVSCGNFTTSIPILKFNDVIDVGGTAYGGICSDQTGQNGNISADPLFVNAAGSDFHLQGTSPSIDAGSDSAPSLPSLDLAGNERVLDGNGDCQPIVDMGAYEFARVSMLTLSPLSLTFGDQVVGTTSATQSATVTNAGTATVSVCSIMMSGDFGQTSTCLGSLASKASCAVNVTFTPTASGTRSGSAQIVTDDTANQQLIMLSGKGVAPVVALSSTVLTFAGQLKSTISAAQTVTLSNTGDGTLTISGMAITGDFTETNTCNGSVAAGANCTISVTFSPTAKGARNGLLTITDNASGSPHTVPLTGTGADFSLMAASGGSTSATVTDGGTATYNLEVAQAGGFTGTVTLSCSGAPTLAICAVSPTTVTLGGADAPFTVTVSTTAASLMGTQYEPPATLPLIKDVAKFVVLAALTLVMLGSWASGVARTRRRWLTCEVLLLLVVVGIAGCGGGGGSEAVHNSGTPKGTATLTVTGTSSGVMRSVVLTLSVN
jgi:Abnormal spindle-like microcephaly-assoc'd, ASPM-SPD-2-Hydin